MFLYAIHSKGKTLHISSILILFEFFTIPVALFFDVWSIFWQPNALQFAFEPMKNIEKFSTSFKSHMKFTAFECIDSKEFRLKISRLVRQFEWTQVIDTCNEFLDSFKGGILYCMNVHIVESCRRVAFLGSYYSLRMNSNGALYMYKLIILIHLLTLPLAMFLDRLAHNLHLKNIPILFHDLPKIETKPIDF